MQCLQHMQCQCNTSAMHLCTHYDSLTTSTSQPKRRGRERGRERLIPTLTLSLSQYDSDKIQGQNLDLEAWRTSNSSKAYCDIT